jgi:mRNA-degrading endonuclease RelE of RelBE toxin-antitoxin system
MSTAVTEPVKLTVSSSPVIFLADNINTDNEIEKIKFLKSGYSSSSTNSERNKETGLLGDLLNFVEDLKINSHDTEESLIQKKENNYNNKFRYAGENSIHNKNSISQDIFMTKVFQKPNNNLLLPKSLQQQLRNRNASQETLSKMFTTDFYSQPIEKYSPKNNSQSFKSKLFSYYSNTKSAFGQNQNQIQNTIQENPYDIENEYINYKQKTKNNKNFINQISSFGMKLNSELGKISHGYGRPENHIKFSENPLTIKCFDNTSRFDAYKNFKISESRKTHNYRFKLAPLNGTSRYNRFDKFGNKFFNNKAL